MTRLLKLSRNIKFDTKNLIIRPIRIKDAKDIWIILQDKIYSENIPQIPYPYTILDANKFIKESIKNSDLQSSMVFVIYSKKIKKVIGVESLTNIDLKNKNCISGCWIDKKYWGTGLILESKFALLNFAFKELRLHKIKAHILCTNLRSIKHYVKLGFKRQGTLKDEIFKSQKFFSAYYYELLNTDYNFDKIGKLLKK